MKSKLLFTVALAAVFLGADALAASRGGSNYHFFQLDGCNREPYGVLKNFHTHTAQIQSDLVQMYDNGQRRLRIGVFHGRGLNSGTLIDSAGGNISPQYRQNLVDLLATIRAVGFVEIQFAFFPQGQNNPGNWAASTGWSSQNESYFQENWNLIYNLMPILRASGIHFTVDLGNELFLPQRGARAAPNNRAIYASKLWANFRTVFSIGESMGFSVRPSEIDNLSEARLIYGNFPPFTMSIHMYGDYYNNVRKAHAELNAANYGYTGLVVGEVPYNDADVASQVNSASLTIGSRPLHWLTQWPLRPGAACSETGVNVAPPLDFGNYIIYGF
jgi:hypothetical protein